MKVIKKPLTELRRPDRNVRMHTDKQLKEFRRSVEMFGQIRPIVVDEDGVILAGNGLYETLLSLGRTEADCYVVSGLTEAEKKKLMLADNRVFDLGVDDLAALDAFILELKDDLDIPGYEEDLLRAMVMEADEASDALLEYGTIEPEQAAAITETPPGKKLLRRRLRKSHQHRAARRLPPSPLRGLSSARNVVSGYGCKAHQLRHRRCDCGTPADQECIFQRCPRIPLVFRRQGQHRSCRPDL